MKQYAVMVKRSFVFAEHYDAESALDASNQACNMWGVPNGGEKNMAEELQTMQSNLDSGQIVPLAIVTEAIDVV